MSNLFVESEEIVYKVIVGDPIFDVYDDDDRIQYKYIEFDLRALGIKNSVVYCFTPTKSFQVINKQRVGFTHKEEHATTCVSQKKETLSTSSRCAMVTHGNVKSSISHDWICKDKMMDRYYRSYYFFQLGRYYDHRKKRRKRLFEDHG